MIEWISAPLQYPFMVRGMIAATLVGIVCAVLGCFIILRGMAFLGDALSHAILPGVAAGYLLGNGSRDSVFWWAMGTALLSSLGISAVTRTSKSKRTQPSASSLQACSHWV